MKKSTFHVIICEAKPSILIKFAFISNHLIIRRRMNAQNFLLMVDKVFLHSEV